MWVYIWCSLRVTPIYHNAMQSCFSGGEEEAQLELQAVMQGSKRCAFRRHNANHVFKRYPEPVDTKDLTVVGVARSLCGVFAAKFCRRYTISLFIAPPNGEMCRIWTLSDVYFLIFFDFWFSTSNLANIPIFKTLPFRRQRSHQKSVWCILCACVWRCRVQSLVSIGQEMWEK